VLALAAFHNTHRKNNYWNALPTSGNARGIDIIIYSQDAVRKYAIQAKARLVLLNTHYI